MSPTIPSTSSPWVPMWNLNGGADLRYNGAYVAGSYTDGDVVVYQGVAYLCVRPTSQPPKPWPGMGIATGYGTSLPASPVDGQEYVLVDSVTNPSYQWRFRYNAGSASAYKWEFVGGAPSAQHETATVAINAAPTWGATGPIFAIPRPGVYFVDFQAMFYAVALPSYISIAVVGPYPPGTAVLSTIYDDRLAAVNAAELTGIRQQLTITSAMTISGGSIYNQSAITSVNRSLVVTPVRVS